jgi:HK97 family phage major capsid protein
MNTKLNSRMLQDVARQASQLAAEVDGGLDLFTGQKNSKQLTNIYKWQRQGALIQARAINELFVSLLEAEKADREPPKVRRMRASNEYVQAWLGALAGGVNVQQARERGQQYQVLVNAIDETGAPPSGTGGAFLAPYDFDRRVAFEMRQYLDLGSLANDIETISFQGWRVLAAGPEDPLEEVTPLGEISDAEHGLLTKIDFELATYGGILPVSGGLFNDSPDAVLEYLAGWWARKVALTNNSLILGLIGALVATPTAVASLIGDLQTALNVTLDPAISDAAAIYTNQAGYDVLENIAQVEEVIDDEGRILRRPVVRLADRLWPDSDAGPLVAVGSLASYCAYFHRPTGEFATTGEGANTWRNRSQEVRGILRADVQEVDTSALVVFSIADSV